MPNFALIFIQTTFFYNEKLFLLGGKALSLGLLASFLFLCSCGGDDDDDSSSSGITVSGLDVVPTHIAPLSNTIGNTYKCGKNVAYFYSLIYHNPSYVESNTDDVIIAELKGESRANEVDDEETYYFSGLSSRTKYVICTVGCDKNGKTGKLNKTVVFTADTSNQPMVTIKNLDYVNGYYTWQTTPNSYATKYYQYVQRSNAKWKDDALLASYILRQADKKSEDVKLVSGEKEWKVSKGSESDICVVTWGMSIDGKMSGSLNKQYFSAGSSEQSIVREAPAADTESEEPMYVGGTRVAMPKKAEMPRYIYR